MAAGLFGVPMKWIDLIKLTKVHENLCRCATGTVCKLASLGTEIEIDVTDNPHKLSDVPFLYLVQVRSLIKANDQDTLPTY